MSLASHALFNGIFGTTRWRPKQAEMRNSSSRQARSGTQRSLARYRPAPANIWLEHNVCSERVQRVCVFIRTFICLFVHKLCKLSVTTFLYYLMMTRNPTWISQTMYDNCISCDFHRIATSSMKCFSITHSAILFDRDCISNSKARSFKIWPSLHH